MGAEYMGFVSNNHRMILERSPAQKSAPEARKRNRGQRLQAQARLCLKKGVATTKRGFRDAGALPPREPCPTRTSGMILTRLRGKSYPQGMAQAHKHWRSGCRAS